MGKKDIEESGTAGCGAEENQGRERSREELTLEETFAQLDQVIEALEDRQTALEDSFRLYQTGMELVKQCSEKIERVESKVLMMNEDGSFDEF